MFLQDYYADVDAIIFLVDAADRSRLDEARIELDALFRTENLQTVYYIYYPIAIPINNFIYIYE